MVLVPSGVAANASCGCLWVLPGAGPCTVPARGMNQPPPLITVPLDRRSRTRGDDREPRWVRYNVLCIDTGACGAGGHLTITEVQSGQPGLLRFA